MTTHRHIEDSTPSEDLYTCPQKTLAKNAKNIMFYHLRGISTPRTSMDFMFYYIHEDTQVLRSISNSRGCIAFLGVCLYALGLGLYMIFDSTLNAC